MTKAETMKRPEYRAWLIRHPFRVLIITVLSWFILGPIIARSANPDSALLVVLLGNVTIMPILAATLPIIVLRWSGTQERVIKNVAMIVYFIVLALGGLAVALVRF